MPPHLPDEVWLHIFSFLQLNTRLNTDDFGQNMWGMREVADRETESCYHALCEVCRVSRRFYHLGQPLLYRSLRFHSPPSRPHYRYSHNPPSRPQYRESMMRTLCARPDLAAAVEEAQISQRDFACAVASTDIVAKGPGVKDQVWKAFVRECSDHGDINIGNILLMVPNLRVLKISTCGDEDSILPKLCDLQRNSDQPNFDQAGTVTRFQSWIESQFPHLRDVRIVNDQDDYDECEWLTDLTLHRGVKKLYASQKHIHKFVHKSTIEHVYLIETHLDNDSFRNLLDHCPRLRTLHVRWGMYVNFSDENWGKLDLNCGTNLEEVELEPRECFDYGTERWHLRGQVKSLRGMTCLKRLKIPRGFLAVGAGKKDKSRLEDALPASLEQLYLCQSKVGASTRDEVLELQRCPRLSALWEVRVDYYDTVRVKTAFWDFNCDNEPYWGWKPVLHPDVFWKARNRVTSDMWLRTNARINRY